MSQSEKRIRIKVLWETGVHTRNRLKRLDFAKKNMNKQWNKVIFCDEASFWLTSGRIKMWTKYGKTQWLPGPKHSPKVHIWAAFSSVGTFPLCIFTQNLTGLLYTKILDTDLLAQANVFHENKWGLVQDNHPKHTPKVVKNWMEVNMPKKLIMDKSKS